MFVMVELDTQIPALRLVIHGFCAPIPTPEKIDFPVSVLLIIS